jgi:ERCC4-type nuclease
MDSRVLNTGKRRQLALFTHDPLLVSRVPDAHLSESISETAVWMTGDGDVFGPLCRTIPADYDFVGNFTPGQSVLYFMPSGRIEAKVGPSLPKLRTVSVVLAAGENKLFAAINRGSLPGRDVKVTLEPLPCGDAVFFIESDGPRKRFEIVIERKTPADFLSSIKDKRLKEQTALMLTTFATPAAIIHFLEGDPMETPSGIHPKARMGALLKPMLREGTSAVIGHGIEATARFILNIQMYLETVPEDELVRKGLLLTHEPNARMDIKKADMTDENKIIYQLRLVPGVGEIMAEAVAAEVKSFDEMEEQYRLFGKHALKDITVPGVAGRKNRKVGKAISEKIYEYYNFDKHKDGVEMMHKKRKIVEDEDEEEEDEIED